MLRKLLLLFFVVAVSVSAREKDVDPAHYPQTAIVSAATTGTVQTTTSTRIHYKNYAEIAATIGGTTYTLRGSTLLPPGEYKVRFMTEYRRTVVEFLAQDAKGRADGAKFSVAGMAAKETK